MQQDSLQKLIAEKDSFLNYFKSIFPVFHNSNIFFRDLQYAIQKYLVLKGDKVTYAQAEVYGRKFTKHLETESILTAISSNTWRLNYELFKTGAPHTFEIKQTA